MAKQLTKKTSKKSSKTTETPKPTVGFFSRLSANKTLGSLVVNSANLFCFATRKVLNMTWMTVTFAAIFFTPIYKCLEAEASVMGKEEEGSNPNQNLPEGIIG